jgi:hypothetical protein
VRGERGRGRGQGKGEEMTQTLYAHMNKRKKYIYLCKFIWKKVYISLCNGIVIKTTM